MSRRPDLQIGAGRELLESSVEERAIQGMLDVRAALRTSRRSSGDCLTCIDGMRGQGSSRMMGLSSARLPSR